MHLIRIDKDTIMRGRAVFQMYIARAACGPGSHAYEFGRDRETGAPAITGCILECIDRGLTNDDDIVHAVARATLCRRSTVEAFLDCLTGDDPSRHLWHIVDGHFRKLSTVVEPDRPAILLAA